MRILGLNRHADIHVQLLTDNPKLQVDVVLVLCALGIAAQAVREIALVWIVEKTEKTSPVTIFIEYIVKGFLIEVGEVIGRWVAFLVAVAIIITRLKEYALQSLPALVHPPVAGEFGDFLLFFWLENQQRFSVGDAKRSIKTV